MKLHSIKTPKNNLKTRKRVGRGEGSGLGKQSGKGHKGQKAMSGYKKKLGFEGGQMPLIRRVPKFGFKNPFRVEYTGINLDTLDDFHAKGKLSDVITVESLIAAGLADKNKPVKILGRGDAVKNLTIEANAFTKSALQKIEEAGGKANVI
ncbi:MAG: LSU ribosomal protein L15 RplO [Bacteroidetes bacterium HLUCCA01]|nr:MAG: LSU ribosomal protein L15 RplO [Bacteroidetes bacterium HLUCCA01]